MQKKESITCVILSSDYSLGDLLGIISDSLGVFVIPQEYLVSFYQNTLLIAILKALIIRDKSLIIRFF